MLWLVGLAGAMDWLPADDSDDWLHFGLGVVMVDSAFYCKGDEPTRWIAAAPS